MFLSYADREQLNVKVGDTVSVQGNRGIVTEVAHGRYDGKNYVDVRVRFNKECALADTFYDNEWYGGFVVVNH